MTKRDGKSSNWAKRQAQDAYSRRARAEGFRSRAAYKLLEIARRDSIFAGGGRLTVVDLGAAPGGWSQAARRAAPAARIVAVDLLPLSPLAGVDFVRGDFADEEIRARVLSLLPGGRADVVLSDLSPDLAGAGAIDDAAIENLNALALDFGARVLRAGGAMALKTFSGAATASRGEMESMFARVAARKPAASRSASDEMYLVGRGRRG